MQKARLYKDAGHGHPRWPFAKYVGLALLVAVTACVVFLALTK